MGRIDWAPIDGNGCGEGGDKGDLFGKRMVIMEDREYGMGGIDGAGAGWGEADGKGTWICGFGLGHAEPTGVAMKTDGKGHGHCMYGSGDGLRDHGWFPDDYPMN